MSFEFHLTNQFDEAQCAEEILSFKFKILMEEFKTGTKTISLQVKFKFTETMNLARAYTRHTCLTDCKIA